MALDPLVAVEDVEERLGRDLDAAGEARAEALIADASASVRAYTGQQFTQGTSTVRLKVRNMRVRLGQRPALDVATVTDTDGNDLDFTWHSGDVVVLSTMPTGGWVDVTYDHGYEEIPGDIIAVVCQVVGRAFGTPADEGGYQSESIGSYSYTVGAAAAAGSVGLLNDERAVLERYRRVGGMARLSH